MWEILTKGFPALFFPFYTHKILEWITGKIYNNGCIYFLCNLKGQADVITYQYL